MPNEMNHRFLLVVVCRHFIVLVIFMLYRVVQVFVEPYVFRGNDKVRQNFLDSAVPHFP